MTSPNPWPCGPPSPPPPRGRLARRAPAGYHVVFHELTAGHDLARRGDIDMVQYLSIHIENPQGRLIQEAAQIIRAGGVVVYPTDTTYALGCRLGDRGALARIRRIRGIGERHDFTLICRDLSESGVYASFNTPVFRLLKAHTPGSYTFILRATREVPRMLLHPKKKTIGLRIPDHAIVRALLTELAEPMLTSTLRLPGDEHPLSDPDEIRERLQQQVDLVIDGGRCGLEPTTLIDLVDGAAEVLREGAGDVSPFVWG